MNEKILRDWDNADQYLNDNLNNVDGNLNGIISDVEHIKGTAEGQFIYDSEAKMTKVVPENVGKGIVAMIGGKTVKTKNLWSYTSDDFNNATDFGSSKRIDIKLKANTKYTLSTNVPQYAADTASIWINGTSSLVNGAWDGHPVTITTDSTGDTFIAYRTSLLSSYDTYWYMLEEGSEATEYEPYHEDLWNAPVDKITINNKVIPIPSSILNLPDYGFSAGDAYNYVDFEEMVYHHRVIHISGEDERLSSNYVRTLSPANYTAFYFKEPKRKLQTNNIVCNKYPTVPFSTGSVIDMPDKSIMASPNRNDNAIVIKDTKLEPFLSTKITTADITNEPVIIDFFKELDFCYELATEELIDISDILMPFMLESGGTITFENEHSLDVPNSVIYEKEMI